MADGMTRPGWRVTLFLAGIGAICGAVAAVFLTFLGNLISGSPSPPGLAVYAWNAQVFALFFAVISPVLAWTMLRRVPLWRAVAEPALGGIVGTVAAGLISPALFPIIAPASILAAALRLHHAFRDKAPRKPLPPAAPRGGVE